MPLVRNARRNHERAATTPLLSVVVPVYNEHANLPQLCQRLNTVLAPLPYRHEIVLVDDGSRDGSDRWITEAARRTAAASAIAAGSG